MATAVARRQNLVLRDYQLEANNAIANAFLRTERRIWRQILVMATGLGKTACFASLPSHPRIAAYLAQHPRGHRKILVVAHREELLDQAADKIAWANPNLAIGIEQAGRHAHPNSDVVIASTQTLAALNGRRSQLLNPDEFRIVVHDECHRATSPTSRRIHEYFGFLPPANFYRPKQRFGSHKDALAHQRRRMYEWDRGHVPDRLLLGVTATPKRGDNTGLEAVFQDVVFSRSIQDGIRDKWLCRLRAIRLVGEVDLDAVSTRAGDFAADELAEAVDVEARNTMIVKGWRQHAWSRKKTVAFCANVQHAQDLAEAFGRHGISSDVIHGSLCRNDRRAVLKRFHDGEIKVLTNCAVLIEGWDEPEVDCIIMARPTKSSLLYIQSVGRGSRIAPKKKDCLVIDVVDATLRHSLITVPSIFGLPVGWDCEGADLLEQADEVEELEKKHSIKVQKHFTLKDVKLQIEEAELFITTDAMVREYATLAWVKHHQDYLLMWLTGRDQSNYVMLRPMGRERWRIFQRTEGKKAEVIADADLANAFFIAEQWLWERQPYRMQRRKLRSPWRRQRATDAQLNYMAENTLPARPGITQGEASDMIVLHHTLYGGAR